jgi:hypothetical protein
MKVPGQTTAKDPGGRCGRPGLARRRARCQNAATHERHEPFRTALSLLLLRLAGRVVYLSVPLT